MEKNSHLNKENSIRYAYKHAFMNEYIKIAELIDNNDVEEISKLAGKTGFVRKAFGAVFSPGSALASKGMLERKALDTAMGAAASKYDARRAAIAAKKIINDKAIAKSIRGVKRYSKGGMIERATGNIGNRLGEGRVGTMFTNISKNKATARKVKLTQSGLEGATAGANRAKLYEHAEDAKRSYKNEISNIKKSYTGPTAEQVDAMKQRAGTINTIARAGIAGASSIAAAPTISGAMNRNRYYARPSNNYDSHRQY